MRMHISEIHVEYWSKLLTHTQNIYIYTHTLFYKASQVFPGFVIKSYKKKKMTKDQTVENRK